MWNRQGLFSLELGALFAKLVTVFFSVTHISVNYMGIIEVNLKGQNQEKKLQINGIFPLQT